MNEKQIVERLRELIESNFLVTENPEFAAFVAMMPEKYWAKYDLSAVRLGWEAADLLERMAWVPVSERLPVFDETLRVEIYTGGVDFAGEQLFDVRAIDLYDEHPSEVCAAATHWRHIDPPGE